MTNLLLTLANSANIIIATNNVTFETNVYESVTEPLKPSGWQQAVYVPPPPTNVLLFVTNNTILYGWEYVKSNTLPAPREKFIGSNVFKISTFDFEWNGQRRRITDREVLTNAVWKFRIKEQWEEVK